jgi:nickel transport protein
LTVPAGLFVLLTALFSASRAQAHRLDAQAFLLPQRKIQVESWFSDGTIPKDARVQVYRTNGELLTEGHLDKQGVFVFAFEQAEPLKVVVLAGAGHRKEINLLPEDLARMVGKNADGLEAAQASNEPTRPIPLADRGTPETTKDVVIGVGFLLALAAFILSVRNARVLRNFGDVSKRQTLGPLKTPSEKSRPGGLPTVPTQD